MKIYAIVWKNKNDTTENIGRNDSRCLKYHKILWTACEYVLGYHYYQLLQDAALVKKNITGLSLGFSKENKSNAWLCNTYRQML